MTENYLVYARDKDGEIRVALQTKGITPAGAAAIVAMRCRAKVVGVFQLSGDYTMYELMKARPVPGPGVKLYVWSERRRR